MDPRQANRIREKMAKAAEMHSQKIEVNDDFEIITHEVFVNALKDKIKSMRLRPLPPGGGRWKRTPFDELEEEGFFTPIQGVVTELVRILNGKSNKSSAKRALIRSICSDVYQQVKDNFEVVPSKK